MERIVINFAENEDYSLKKRTLKKIFDDFFMLDNQNNISVKVYLEEINKNPISKKKEKYVLHLLKMGYTDEYIMSKAKINIIELEKIKRKR